MIGRPPRSALFPYTPLFRSEKTADNYLAVVDRLARLFLVVPVALHHRIAAGAELAGRAARHRLALGVDDLDLEMRHHLAHRRDAPLHRIVGGALRRHGPGPGHAVGDGGLAHVHLASRLLP